MRLNLGSNDAHSSGFVNVDICPPADQIVDLRRSWPWGDSSIEEIRAHDVFEHLYRIDENGIPWMGNVGKIWALNESWRVLKPGGRLDLWVPCVMLSDGRINPGAFADPTHVSFWTMDDQYYLEVGYNNPQGERGRLGPAYGITALFKALKWELFEYGAAHERRSKVVALLEAVK